MSLQETFLAAVQALPEGELSEVARRAKINRRTVTRWRAGEANPSLSNVERLARALRSDPLALLGGHPAAVGGFEDAGEDYVTLPQVASQVAAGGPVYDPGEVEERFAFRADFVRRLGATDDPYRLVVVRVARDHKGESMVPTIQPGALLVVDRGPGGQGHVDPIKPGGIYLVRPPNEDGVTVKRLFESGRQLILWSDNPAHLPQTIDVDGRRRQRIVVGRVRWVAQEVD